MKPINRSAASVRGYNRRVVTLNGSKIADIGVVSREIATVEDLGAAFQSAIDRLPVTSDGERLLAEFGALIVAPPSSKRLDTVLFPEVVIAATDLPAGARGWLRCRSFPKLSLAADPQTNELLLHIRTTFPRDGDPAEHFLRFGSEVFCNQSDLWSTFGEDDQELLRVLGFGPGLSMDQWGREINRVIKSTSRAAYRDSARLTRNLPGELRYGCIGTARAYYPSADFLAKALAMNELEYPGEDLMLYASAHIHPDVELTGLEAQLAENIGDDFVRHLPTLTEVRGGLAAGTALINRFASLADAMMVIDSQFLNDRVMKPLVDSEYQYQEGALAIVAMSREGVVESVKIFDYNEVVRRGELDRFDNLVEEAYRSSISDQPDVSRGGIIAEAMQEICRFTSDTLPDYMGRP